MLTNSNMGYLVGRPNANVSITYLQKWKREDLYKNWQKLCSDIASKKMQNFRPSSFSVVFES